MLWVMLYMHIYAIRYNTLHWLGQGWVCNFRGDRRPRHGGGGGGGGTNHTVTGGGHDMSGAAAVAAGASNTVPRHSAWQPMQYIQLFIMLLYRIAYICMWNMNHNIFRATALGCYLGMLRLMSCTPAATNTIAIVLIMLCCYCFSNFMDLNNMRKKWNLDADLCWITTHPFSDTLAVW